LAQVTFILGGCRSGKSRFALEAAAGMPADQRVFIATAVPFDEEMRARVARHQAERGDAWTTIEAPQNLPEAIQEYGGGSKRVVLVDCLTLWINNLLLELSESRSGFLTPSDARGRRCRPLEMLTTDPGCSAFESACALPAGVIQGSETTSSLIRMRISRLIEAIESARCPVVLVSNEVGAGIVPENRLARSFRDLVGSMNQAVAACASRVFWVVAGIPVAVKNEGAAGS
jgi:adenosylcobinamide kinase / adenosylcobinamide-phosphate guanylyltransferase